MVFFVCLLCFGLGFLAIVTSYTVVASLDVTSGISYLGNSHGLTIFLRKNILSALIKDVKKPN